VHLAAASWLLLPLLPQQQQMMMVLVVMHVNIDSTWHAKQASSFT
jgi:hypothetical protein